MTEIPPALARQSVERTQLSRKVQAEERREQVLERLIAVFAKRGYQAATVDHLIAGAKISMGGFYKDFDGKEDCFVAVYDRVLSRIRDRLADAVEEAADWPTQAAVGVRALLEFAVEEPMDARLVVLEAQTGGPLMLDRYRETRSVAAGFLRRGRELTESQERLPPNFEDASLSGMLWLLQSRLAQGRLEEADELYPHVATMVLEPYVGAVRAEQVLRAATGKTRRVQNEHAVHHD